MSLFYDAIFSPLDPEISAGSSIWHNRIFPSIFRGSKRKVLKLYYSFSLLKLIVSHGDVKLGEKMALPPVSQVRHGPNQPEGGAIAQNWVFYPTVKNPGARKRYSFFRRF